MGPTVVPTNAAPAQVPTTASPIIEPTVAVGPTVVSTQLLTTVLTNVKVTVQKCRAASGAAGLIESGALMDAGTGSRFLHNRADMGGAIHASDPGTQVQCSECQFELNVAATNGGAVHLQKGAVITAQATRFQANMALVVGCAMSSCDIGAQVQGSKCQFERNQIDSKRGGHEGAGYATPGKQGQRWGCSAWYRNRGSAAVPQV